MATQVLSLELAPITLTSHLVGSSILLIYVLLSLLNLLLLLHDNSIFDLNLLLKSLLLVFQSLDRLLRAFNFGLALQ